MRNPIVTVRGPVASDDLGMTLPHEHVLCDFGGAETAGRNRYDPDEVVRVMRPYLTEAARRGVSAFVDCSTAYLGRDVELLRALSESTGVHILTNTGYYGASEDKYLPRHAFRESAGALAERWILEWEDGIDGTDVRPGFIKIGVDPGPLSAVDRKLVEAAARAHLATGLTIACHTGEAVAAAQVLDTVLAAGVSAEALILVHVDAIPDPEVHAALAERGAWVELDGVGPDTTERHVDLVGALVGRGYTDQILLSHDAGWYNVGEDGGGTVRPYTAITDRLIPALARRHPPELIKTITVANPARAFSPGEKRRP